MTHHYLHNVASGQVIRVLVEGRSVKPIAGDTAVAVIDTGDGVQVVPSGRLHQPDYRPADLNDPKVFDLVVDMAAGRPSSEFNDLVTAGKHLAVKLAEVYRAAGRHPAECQAIRDFHAAIAKPDPLLTP